MPLMRIVAYVQIQRGKCVCEKRLTSSADILCLHFQSPKPTDIGPRRILKRTLYYFD